MKSLGLKAVIKKKRPTYSKVTEEHVSKNVLNRQFHAEKPNQNWCTDVTELRYGNGKKAYLSAIIDLYDHSIISWVLSQSYNNRLVRETIEKAMKKILDRSHFFIVIAASNTLLTCIRNCLRNINLAKICLE